MSEASTVTPTVPLTVRALLLFLLPLVVALIYLDSRHYDQDLLNLKASGQPSSTVAGFFPELIAGLSRTGRIQQFSRNNLYEYINGHAEFFIGAGFRALAVGEYGASSTGERPTLVVNIYDMGSPINAFGVLVDEAGETAEPVEIGAMGFMAGQGVNFINSRYYIQVSSFNPLVSPLQVSGELNRTLGVSSSDDELAFYFPDLGEVVATRFVKEDYRGLGFLQNVVERTFRRESRTIQAFLVNGSGDEIDRQVALLKQFLHEEGIAFAQREFAGRTMYRVMDPYEGEWFFLSGEGRLLGIFAAPDEELLNRLVANTRPREQVYTTEIQSKFVK